MIHDNKTEVSKPPEYANNYTTLNGDIRGLSAAQRAEAGKPLSAETSASTPGATRPNPAPVTGIPQHGEATPDRTLMSLTVVEVADDAFRGDAMVVTGVARAESGPAPEGVPVSIYFAPDGVVREAILVGETVTGRDGSFRVEIELSSRMPIGHYDVYAVSGGNERFAPSRSR